MLQLYLASEPASVEDQGAARTFMRLKDRKRAGSLDKHPESPMNHRAIKTNSAAAHRPNKVQNATVPVAPIDCRFGFGAPSELQYTVASAAPTSYLEICGPQKNIRHSLCGATGTPASHQESAAPRPSYLGTSDSRQPLSRVASGFKAFTGVLNFFFALV